MSDKEKSEFMYDVPDRETLRYDERDEAIYHILDEYYDDHNVDELPLTIVLCKYQRFKMTERFLEEEAQIAAENTLERFDEGYGGEDYEKVGEKHIEVARKFVNEMASIYDVWRCEEISRETINTKEWVEKHCPEWIADGKIKFEKESK